MTVICRDIFVKYINLTIGQYRLSADHSKCAQCAKDEAETDMVFASQPALGRSSR